MTKIRFSNGQVVDFDGDPTPEDVDYVAQQLGIKPDAPKQEQQAPKKSVARKVGDFFTKSTQAFGSTLGTAASVVDPQTIKSRNEMLATTNEAIDNYLRLASQEKNKEKAQQFLEAAKKLADTNDLDIFSRPEYQKTAKQIGGEALGTAIEVAGFGTYGSAAKTAQVAKAAPTVLTGVKAGAKVGAVYGGLGGVSTAMQEDKSVADIAKQGLVGAGVGAVAGGVIGGAAVGIPKSVKAGTKLTKKATAKTGQLLEAAGQRVERSAIPLSKREAQMVQTYKANNPLLKRLFTPLETQPRTTAVTALDKGFVGTESMIGVQAKKEANKLWRDKIAPSVDKLGKNYSLDDAFKAIKSQIDEVADPSRQIQLMDAYNALIDDYSKMDRVISFTQAQKIKSDMAKFIPDKVYQGKPIASAFKDIQSMLANDIRQTTYNALKDQNIKIDYLDWGNLQRLQELGQKAMTGAGKQGGFGSFVSTVYQEATYPFKTLAAQALKKSGQTLSNVGKQVSSKPLLQSKATPTINSVTGEPMRKGLREGSIKLFTPLPKSGNSLATQGNIIKKSIEELMKLKKKFSMSGDEKAVERVNKQIASLQKTLYDIEDQMRNLK